MKRISIVAAIFFLVSCVPLYGQPAGPASSQPQQLKPSDAPEPPSDELAYLPPDVETEMVLPESDEMPLQEMAETDAPFEEENGFAALPRGIGKLNLTDTQKKDVDKIVFDAAKQTIAQRAKVATARLELRQLFKADSPDKNAIEKKMNEIADLSTQIRIDHVDGWFAINKLLTPDQQKIWKHTLAMHAQMVHRAIARHFGNSWQHPQVDRRAGAHDDAPRP